MKRAFLGSLGLALTLALYVPCSADGHRHHHKDNVKYVKGGACAPGKGTKKSPFATLQEAEASSFDVLIVLSSATPLEGSITLKNGQKLIGEEDPTCLGLSPTQPTITNPTDTVNDGHAVIVMGDATIKNIFFRDIFGSAIFYDDAEDLSVQHVLIDGYDEGSQGNPAIRGLCSNNGKTVLEQVIIRNGPVVGVAEQSENGAQRKLIVCSSEFSDIQGTAVFSAAGDNSTSDAKISHCFFHGITGTANTAIYQSFANPGGQQKSCIDHSTFSDNSGLAIPIATVANSGLAELKVTSCLIEEQVMDPSSNAIFVDSVKGSTKLCVNNTTCANFGSFARVSTDADTSIQSTELLNNTVTAGVFLAIGNFAAAPGGLSTASTVLRDNLFTAIGSGQAAISVFASQPWKTFTLCAEKNCFESNLGPAQSFGFAVLGNAGRVAAATPATISAHHNTITGFYFDIGDDNGGVQYDVTKNFWGPLTAGPCISCQPYQTCVMGGCLGPDNVVLVGSAISKVDATKPLLRPIKCPYGCCQTLGVSPQPRPLVDTTPSAELFTVPRVPLVMPILPKKRS